MFQGNVGKSPYFRIIHRHPPNKEAPFKVFFFLRLFRPRRFWRSLRHLQQCDARKMQALGFSEEICGPAFPYKVGPEPIVTNGVIAPINARK